MTITITATTKNGSEQRVSFTDKAKAERHFALITEWLSADLSAQYNVEPYESVSMIVTNA